MSNQATYDDANLVLRLYELRREEKLRQAREWFGQNFLATTMEEVQQIAPPGTQENTYLRMVVSYWDMAASFVTSGILNQDLFLQTNGELVFVWERIRALAPAFREFMKNPGVWHNLEIVGNAGIQMMQSRGPEAYGAFQAMVRSVGPQPKS